MTLSPQYVVSGLIKRGIPPVAAQAFAGNGMVESRLDPSINEVNPTVKGSRGGFGLMQWTGPRRRQLETFAASRGVDVSDPEMQMDFLAWELGNTEKGAADAIYQAQTPDEAARLVSERFLRPGIPHLDARISATRGIAGGDMSGGGGSDMLAGGSGNDTMSSGDAQFDAIYQAYAQGLMDADARAEYEQDAKAGLIPLPQGSVFEAYKAGGSLGELSGAFQTAIVPGPRQGQPAPIEIPQSVMDAFTSGQMDADAVEELKADLASGAAILPQRQYTDAPYENALGLVFKGTPMEGFARDIGRAGALTARSLTEGAAGAIGLGYDPIAATINAGFGTAIPPLQEQVATGLTDIGVPLPQNAPERIAGALGRGVGGVGVANIAARGAGGLAQQGLQMLGASTFPEIGAVAGSSLAAQGAAEAGGSPTAQFIAGLGGGALGGIAGAKMQGPAPVIPAAPTQAQQTVANADRLGVRVMTSDINPPESAAARWVSQTVPEAIPFAGMGKPRMEQQAQRVDAIKQVAQEFGATTVAQASADVMADLAKKRGADVAKYSTMKGDVIDRLSGQPVPVTRAVDAIDNEITSLTALNTKGLDPVISRLSDWKNALIGVTDQKLPNGQTVQVSNGQPLANIEQLRKQIGASFQDPSLAGVRDIGQKSLSRIYGPLRDDMGEFIKSTGQRQDFNKWSVANKRLAEMMDELDSTALKSSLNKADIEPETVKKLLFSKSPSQIRLLYKNLTPAGRQRAQAAVMADAIEKAGGVDALSPERFLTDVKKRGDQIGVFFSGKDKAALDGLVKVLEITRRAGVANVSPPTGQNLVPLGLGGAAVSAAGSLVGQGTAALLGGTAMLGTAGGLARAYESPTVRNLLIKLNSAHGVKAQDAIAQQIVAAMRATQNTQQEGNAQ